MVTSAGTKDVAIYAYLAYSDFTDPYAVYSVNTAYSIDSTIGGTINQDKAKNGWNYISFQNVSFGDCSVFARVRASSISGYNTGADAIRVTYYD